MFLLYQILSKRIFTQSTSITEQLYVLACFRYRARGVVALTKHACVLGVKGAQPSPPYPSPPLFRKLVAVRQRLHTVEKN